MGENGQDDYVRDDILANEEMRKIYVARIPSEAQDEELKTLFENVANGTVVECVVVRKDDKKLLFGFVTFETAEQVDDVLLKRESLKYKDKVLDVNRAVPKTDTWEGAHQKTKKLFIANLPLTTTEDELQKYFEERHPKQYGTVESVQLVKKKDDQGNKTDVNKGYGFIMVSSEDMADKMAIQHKNFTLGGRKIELKKNVEGGSADGGRGRGRGRGGDKGMRGGRGGAQFQGYGGGYEAAYGGQWSADAYGGGYGGYNQGYGGGYGAGGYGYGAAQQGGNRFQPY